MYHPSSELPEEEYVELKNTGAALVDVSGWQLTSGVTFTIPASTSIPAAGYLVVTANPTAFHAKYPAVTNYVSSVGWTGQLSNSSNALILKNAAAVKIDEVDYSDDGDWGQRERDEPPSFGHRGWGWNSAADGSGKSLELVNATFDNDQGQNWLPSTTTNGSPGAANSVASADIAPVITKVEHFPLIPASTDAVTVTARVRDDNATVLTVDLRYRNDGAGSFSTAPMFDDGAHGDALASDGIYGAQLSARANGTIVEFYIRASDAATNTRYWPAKAKDFTGTFDHYCNCLYQVDDTVYSGTQPIYYLVLKAADKTELNNINTNSDTPPFAFNAGETSDQTYSHARFNGTFISRDGTGMNLQYLAGTRNRGNGSRNTQPQSMNIQFPNGDAWNGIHGLNLNTQHTPFQMFGSALMRKCGLVMAESRAVQVRVNATNSAGTGNPAYGFYSCNEAQDSDFCDHHFPLDSSGNLYRGFRNDSGFGADLRDQSAGQPAATADAAPYKVNYFKETNVSEDQWADLIGLTKTLAKGHSTAGYAPSWDADFVTSIQATVDVPQWMTYFAAGLICDNNETSIIKGDGDDFYVYFGKNDLRARLITFDLDTIFHRVSGSTTPGDPVSHGIFRMAQSTQGGNPPTPVYPMMVHPEFARMYLAEVKRLLDGPFSSTEFDALADEILGPVWDATHIQAVKDFNASRTAYIRGLLPLAISSVAAQTTAGAALSTVSGYPQSTSATCKLSGKADCIRTASVKVNGVAATYTPWTVTASSSSGLTTTIGNWVANAVALSPGVNRLRIQAFDSTGAEIDLSFFDVWYDDGSVATTGGAIAANTTWTAAGGPYSVTSNLTVNSGVTLTIQPGTSVYLGSGTTMSVSGGGRILAEGTEGAPIRFTRAPGAATNGGTITINGQSGAPETHFYYTFFEFGGDPAVTCAANSNVVFDHCEWMRNTVSYLHLDGGSFLISNCIFPTGAAGSYFEGVHGSGSQAPAGGRMIIRDSFFGKMHSISSDYNDVLDLTGGNRPNPILQFYNNVMTGSDDDHLDLDGTDVWVEGNIFMNVHRSGSPDSASAVSGGNDGGGGSGSRRDVTAIDTATDQLTCGTHGFTTGQEVAATALLGNSFPAATPAMHDGGPYYVRTISTTVVKLYLTAADATANTNAVNFTSGIATGVNLTLQKLDGISHITVVGNIFYNVDQAMTAKEGNFYTFLNNTVIDQSNTGSQDAVTGVLNFGDDTYREAGGMYAEGNIIQSAVALTRNYPGAGLQQTVTWNNNLFPPGLTWSGAGSGNQSADARLADAAIPTPGPYDYHRLRGEIRNKITPLAGSPAKGTGPNGQDKGGARPIGVSIGGAPQGTTNLTTATLTVGRLVSGNGISAGTGAWSNGGSGWTHYKWRLDGGAWSAEIPTPTPITLAGLANGSHTVEVVGKNDAGTYQNDAALGTSGLVSSVTWTVNTAYVPPAQTVRINEILAKNTQTQAFGSVHPDIIELHNPTAGNVSLDGWGLTDNAALPYKYTFPVGTTINAGAYLVIYASGSNSVVGLKTGFGLKDSGDTLALTQSAAAGGGIADVVPFGWQLPDISAGRRATDGVWDMCVPTFGGVNLVAAQDSPSSVRINEWLADAQILAGQDFVELMNPTSLPVNVGSCFLTDNPQAWPTRFQIRQMTFLGPSGYNYFKADGDTAQGPDHLDFHLAAEQGELGFSDSNQALVDNVVYGPQTTDISQGRTPNGGAPIEFFTQPTPGAPNPQVSSGTGGQPQTVDVILPTQVWKYRQSATDPFGGSTTWKDTNYVEDASWLSGGGVLYLESSGFPANTDGFAKTTLLTGYDTDSPYQTYYFRTHFNYTGTMTNVTISAKMMCDDAPILYLNGQEITPTSGTRIRSMTGTDTYALPAPTTAPDATIETFTLNSNGLVVGDNVLAVSLHQQGTQSATTGSSDITWGLKLTISYSLPSVGADNIVINEVLPINTAQANPDGSFNGWIELFNTGAAAADMTDVSVTNKVSTARAFVFPAGLTIPAGGYLLLYCNGQTAPTTTAPFNSGFSLNGDGGGVFIYKSIDNGGGLLASVNYGRQIPDFSIGRVPNASGPFSLNSPTRGGLNSAAATVSATNVKLNEWFTDGAPGWLELYNTSVTPASVGGNFLTDDLIDRAKNLIPPLSFIAGSGASRWQVWTADNDGAATPGHVNFRIESGEALGLLSPTGTILDLAATSAHSPSLTEGRYTDGAAAISYLNPTPGAANQQADGADSDQDGIPDDWELAHGLNPNNPADATADGDFDGLTNLIEFAFNLNPQLGDVGNAGGVSGLPTAQYVAVPGGHVLEIQFLRRKGLAAAHIAYTAKFSSDLAVWVNGLAPTVTSVDADWDLVTVRDSAPATSARRFVRVEVLVVP